MGSFLSVALGSIMVDLADDGWRSEASADACPDASEEWWCRYDQEGFLSLSLVHDDDHLTGAMLGYGTRGYFAEGLRWKTWSAAYQSNEGESVWAVRRDWTIMMPYAMRWGGIGPLFAVGLEYRDGELHPGLGGYIGLGGQLTMWTREHWQFAIVLEHDFGISSESRNAVQAVITFAHPKLGSRPIQ